MNIRVDLTTPIKDGTEVVFRSPVDCSQITGLIVYVTENGNTTSQEFALADAHGNNVGDIDHLFAENVVVKVILDVTTGMAFVQNADTNAYLESRFDGIIKQLCPPIEESGMVMQCYPLEGTELLVTWDSDSVWYVNICGKNLYNKAAYPLDIIGYPYSSTTATGTFSQSTSYKRTGFIPVAHLAGQTIVLSHSPNATNPGMCFYTRIPDISDKDDCKAACCGNTNKASIQVPADAVYMVFSVKNEDVTADVQIEFGSFTTEYEPYASKVAVVDGALMQETITPIKGTNTLWLAGNGDEDITVYHGTVTGFADPKAEIKRLKDIIGATSVATTKEE